MKAGSALSFSDKKTIVRTLNNGNRDEIRGVLRKYFDLGGVMNVPKNPAVTINIAKRLANRGRDMEALDTILSDFTASKRDALQGTHPDSYDSLTWWKGDVFSVNHNDSVKEARSLFVEISEKMAARLLERKQYVTVARLNKFVSGKLGFHFLDGLSNAIHAAKAEGKEQKLAKMYNIIGCHRDAAEIYEKLGMSRPAAHSYVWAIRHAASEERVRMIPKMLEACDKAGQPDLGERVLSNILFNLGVRGSLASPYYVGSSLQPGEIAGIISNVEAMGKNDAAQQMRDLFEHGKTPTTIYI